jgi:hypothetical protein
VFGGFCLLLFLPHLFFPFRGVVFDASFGVVLLGQIVLIRILSAPVGVGVFVWRV